MIKTDLSGFIVTIHSGLYEEYVQSLHPTTSGLDTMFGGALVHCDNNPQNRS